MHSFYYEIKSIEKSKIALLSLLLFIGSTMDMAEIRAETQVYYESYFAKANTTEKTAFGLPEQYAVIEDQQIIQSLRLLHHRNGFQLEAGAYTEQTQISNKIESRRQLNEMYYDFSASEFDFTIGKKIMPWGVGYGFRPLDMIQQEDRLTERSRGLQGVPLASTDYFFNNANISMIYFNRMAVNQNTLMLEDHEWILRYYQLANNTDQYAILHANINHSYSLGLGLSHIAGDALEVHASARYVSNYTRALRSSDAPLLATEDPLTDTKFNDGKQLLLGINWTSQYNFTIIAEVWHNSLAYNMKQWRNLLDITKDQKSLLATNTPEEAIYNNVKWHNRVYQNLPLLQNNAMLRMSYNGEKFEPAVMTLLSPEDKGWLLQMNINYQYNDYLSWFIISRKLGGLSDSVYAEASFTSSILAGLELTKIF